MIIYIDCVGNCTYYVFCISVNEFANKVNALSTAIELYVFIILFLAMKLSLKLQINKRNKTT